MMKNILFHWKRDYHDANDQYVHEHPAFSLTAEPLPMSVDLRKFCSPVFDQGSLGSCFVGETTIPLLNGTTKSLKELYESGEKFWVYSNDCKGRVVPGKAFAKKTGLKRNLVKVTLDNGEEIVCTPEHQFLTREGEYIRANEMMTGLSLMPLVRKHNKVGYEMVFSHDEGKFKTTHKMVKSYFEDKPLNSLYISDEDHVSDLYGNLEKYLEYINKFLLECQHYNHKVLSVEPLDYVEDVYCLEVEKYHNFALSAGVFVHNCTGNALVAALEYLENKDRLFETEDHNEFVNLSRLFVYYQERVLDGDVYVDGGSQISTGIRVLTNTGAASEKVWPYEINKFTVKPSELAYEDASIRKIKGYARVSQSSIDNIKTVLASGYPIVFGFTVFESFMSPEVAATGTLEMPGADEACEGGHAVMLVGYDDATQRVLVRNSWGQWGDQGYFTMPYEYIMSNMANDLWTITK